MRVLFTICGRAGSKGIKNKNIRPFLGYPLPYFTLASIDLFLKNTDMDIECDIAVNTDSKELIDIMQNNPFREVSLVTREESLAGDTVGKIAVIADTHDKMGNDYDMVVDLDITSPLRTPLDIQRVIELSLEKGADVTTTIASCRRNPYFNQVKKTENGYKKVIESNFTARQQAPEIFDMNASIYAYAPAFLSSGKKIFDGYVECVEMYDTGILDLDHENDFLLMERIADFLFSTMDEFGAVYRHVKERCEFK